MAGPGCTRYDKQIGVCPKPLASIGQGRVELKSGSVSSRDRSDGDYDRVDSNSSQSSNPVPISPEPDDNCDFRCDDWSVTLFPDEDDDEDAPAVVVTIADVARFRPAIGGDHMEPNGWAVIGLPANFYARGGVSVKRGELFDRPALVRFTPVAWTWDYGDGGSRTTGQPGASWAALGVNEFDETATSHVFDEPGDFRIQLTISYSAEYQFAGGPWLGIAGTLALPADPLSVTVGDAKTVLVQRECTRNPAGPGC